MINGSQCGIECALSCAQASSSPTVVLAVVKVTCDSTCLHNKLAAIEIRQKEKLALISSSCAGRVGEFFRALDWRHEIFTSPALI